MDGFRGIKQLIGARSLNSMLVLGGTILLTQILSSGTVGQYFLFEAVVISGSTLTEFGTAKAVEQRISSKDYAEPDHISNLLFSSILIQGIAISLVSLVLVVFRAPVDSYLGAHLAIWVIVAMGLHSGGKLVRAILRAIDRVPESATLEAAFRVTWILATVFLLFFTNGELSLMAPVYGLIAGLGLQLGIGLIKIPISLSIPTKETIASVTSFGRFEFLTQIGGLSYAKADILILGFFVASSDVAAYEIAWRISTVVLLPMQAVSATVFPTLTRELNNRFDGSAESIIYKLLGIATLFSIPALFGVMIIGDEMLHVLFPPDYHIAAVPLIILVAEKIPGAYQSVFVNSLKAANRPDLDAVTTVIITITNIILNIILIYKFGIIGAAIATAFSSTIATLMNLMFLRRFVSVKPPIRPIIASIISSMVMALIVQFVNSSIRLNLGTMVLSIIVGVLIYALFVYFVDSLRECAKPLFTSKKYS